jgi:exoribonuclease R
VLTGLKELPEILARSARQAHQYENAVLDLVEAGVLRGREGETFGAVVVDLDDRDETHGTVIVQEPAVEADVAGHDKLPLGEDVEVTLRTADVRTRTVEFALSES